MPRGVTSYTKINEQGMLVSERPTSDSIAVLRPVRPTDTSGNAAPANDNQPLPPGSISREQRCAEAQQNLKTIQTKTNIVEDDGKGNLIALSSEQIAERKQQAEGIVDRYCQSSPEVNGVPINRATMPPAIAPSRIPPAVTPAQPIMPATAVPPPQPVAPSPAAGAEGSTMNPKEQPKG